MTRHRSTGFLGLRAGRSYYTAAIVECWELRMQTLGDFWVDGLDIGRVFAQNSAGMANSGIPEPWAAMKMMPSGWEKGEK